MRKLGLAQRCSGEKGAAGRNPQAHPRCGSGSPRRHHYSPRQRPGPGRMGEGEVVSGVGQSRGVLALGGREARRSSPVLLWRPYRRHTMMCTTTWAWEEHLGVVAESQCGDLLGVAEPVLLGAGVQVLHYHQAAAGVGKEACGREGAQSWSAVALSSSLQLWAGWGLGRRRAEGGRGVCGPYLCLASRSRWPAHSRCSPQQPSGAATRPRQGGRKHSVRKRSGCLRMAQHPATPLTARHLRLCPIRLGPGTKLWEEHARMGQMARAWAQKPTHERPTGDGSWRCGQGGRSGRCGWSLESREGRQGKQG